MRKMLTYNVVQDIAKQFQVALAAPSKALGMNTMVRVESVGFESTRACLTIHVESISPEEQFYNNIQELVGKVMKKIAEKDKLLDRRERAIIALEINNLLERIEGADF